ncbi:lipase maturation factor family protein [Nonomuraea turcica]|uniref:lipase maturation factor family protein n=1 Tax=Nonomuraea sp. G32 TaxID=3067274 RepID=UPI00353053DB
MTGNHVAQLVAPFGLFAPQPYASVAAAFMIATQLWLIISGNVSWLNWLTVVLAASVVDLTMNGPSGHQIDTPSRRGRVSQRRILAPGQRGWTVTTKAPSAKDRSGRAARTLLRRMNRILFTF